MLNNDSVYVALSPSLFGGYPDTISKIVLKKDPQTNKITEVNTIYGASKAFDSISKLRHHMCGIYEPLSIEWYEIMSRFVIYNPKVHRVVSLDEQFGFHPGDKTVSRMLNIIDEDWIAQELLGGRR